MAIPTAQGARRLVLTVAEERENAKTRSRQDSAKQAHYKNLAHPSRLCVFAFSYPPRYTKVQRLST
jgi:hypothetical protein